MSTSRDHIIKSYDEELVRLTGEIARMGELAANQFAAAADAVQRRDECAARIIIGADDAIDAMEHEISRDVMRLLALRAPMAGDLRSVFAALRVAADIERIGDYATNIARRSIPLSLTAAIAPARGLRRLSELAAASLDQVLTAYRNRDADLALHVWQDDVKLDEAYTGLFRELLTYMMEDPRSITSCTHLLFMAKNIERIGDHVTNIAESVWFAVTGSRLDAPRASHDATIEAKTPPAVP